MKKQTISFAATLGLIILFTFHSCKEDEEAVGIDKQMLDMAKETAGFTWFKNSDALLDKSSGSGHNYPFLRTRYNAIASAKLDCTGRIISGSMFPEGSFIVKELYNNSTTLGRYAMLYKQSDDANADANGWVWGYVNADGTVAAPASDKGSGCISCHSQSNNIDYMLMNKFFP
jgi:hypothetical protein